MSARWVKWARLGIHYRYPPCCVIRFCWDGFGRRDVKSGLERGGRRTKRPGGIHVPCGWIHRHDPDMQPMTYEEWLADYEEWLADYSFPSDERIQERP